jgi:hypothetical protein
MTQRERFTLILEPLPDDVPAEIRLRRPLKHLLRACRLRCVRVDDAPPADHTSPASTQEVPPCG